MKEWSDDELDKLFQKSAEELNPPYEPADWQSLRRRLDQADGVTPGGWLTKTLPWLALGLLLLIGGLGVYYGTGDNEGKGTSSVSGTRPTDRSPAGVPGTPRTEALPVPSAANVSEPEKRSQETNSHSADSPEVRTKNQRRVGTEVKDIESKAGEDLKELPRNLASVSGVREQSNRSDQERGEGAILLPKSNSGISPKKGLRAGNPLEVPAGDGRQGTSSQKPLSEITEAMKTRPGELPGQALESQNSTPLRDNWLPVAPLASRRNYRQGEAPAYPVVAYTPGADSRPEASSSTPSQTQRPKWALRLGVSPDLSAVHMSDMMHSMRPGPAASLLAERSIGRKWMLQTGIIRSLKNYSAPFSDYHPDKHLYQATMPVSVDGKCTVFEVPLNARFDFGQGSMSRWFAGAGVSSYKMQKENYTYKYDRYVHNAAKGWGGSTGWYLLSHANASVGYERRLSGRLSLMAEPYMRIPLRGVGFGRVNLFTGGVWFSLRYTPVFK